MVLADLIIVALFTGTESEHMVGMNRGRQVLNDVPKSHNGKHKEMLEPKMW